MSDTTLTTNTPTTPIPVVAPLPWALFTTLLALLAIYFIGTEQGATSMFSSTQMHELFYDVRHLLGFPCH